MTTTTKTCRYCGTEQAKKDVHREGLAQCRTYSCKDVEACGARIREQTGYRLEEANAEEARNDDLPF